MATPAETPAAVGDLVGRLVADERAFQFGVGPTPVEQALYALEPAQRRLAVLAIASYLEQPPALRQRPHAWQVWHVLWQLVDQERAPDLDVTRALLGVAQRLPGDFEGLPMILRTLERYLKRHDLTQPLQDQIRQIIPRLEPYAHRADVRRWIQRLQALGRLEPLDWPLAPGEAWASVALADLEAEPAEVRAAWRALLLHCQGATGAQPSARWRKAASSALEQLGPDRFRAGVLRWFPLVDKPRTELLPYQPVWAPDRSGQLLPANATLLKGLAWCCAPCDDRAVAQALAGLAVSAYRKIPRAGPRCVRLGNACLWALGEMPGLEGIGQLAVLRLKVKLASVQRGIDHALARAAARAGLSPADLEELAVPDYGLLSPGRRQERLGDWTAELSVASTTTVNLAWLGPGGKRQASAPARVRAEHPAELKALQQAAKDITRMLPAQRDRLERLYLEPRTWRLAAWRAHYLDHPLMGALARRLIWKFSQGDQAASGIWHAGRIVTRDDTPLTWLTADTLVELWHPLQASPETVLAWRAWLGEHAVQQPFKQAHREVYPLTEAERATGVYSNRFAAHVLRQHQFHALCAARGWHNRLRLMVDDHVPPATRLLPAWGLRAEFWVEGAGDNYGTDTNETGTFYYVSTDQVRFYPLGAPENWAHAGGGGYYALGQAAAGPLALDDVPPLVLSEIMRDIDLFVGVASVGNDPTWGDRGPETRHRNYWHDFAFGQLSVSAQTRRQILEGLLPRLKIAERCSLAERFLVVRGRRRTYKIHLGSGNILMEPNDQYLCIVPAQGKAGLAGAGSVFLPFEGDQTLAIILSKAFLLAADDKIKDPTIVRQLAR